MVTNLFIALSAAFFSLFIAYQRVSGIPDLFNTLTISIIFPESGVHGILAVLKNENHSKTLNRIKIS